ncbi:Flp pilus assembly protein CpaB [Sulfitobacter aestuariivivens]|uniref:Flp pilus assembly protein CpaB n=1 Tax=Sulfitobacter aestuariivivens TaxID=2766981 RepID=A0A927DAJ7_9RHOB|nr:Flp pilus assembly protein CpaB [Sulfitobacter aestuariivivens]MBD3666207.1 Flp pilus assembly protein CpaB [Sulfitobacter aestuariivivens]
MRFSTILSLLVAIVLAGAAVYGAQNWLSTERQEFMTALQQQAQREDEAPKDTIVVAAEAVQFGERINRTTVREIEWSGAIRPEGSYAKIEDLVIGEGEDTARFALTPMAIGEPILSSKVTEPGVRAKMSTILAEGMTAVSIRVNDIAGVAGFVLPGDRVNVMLTRNGFTDVLLQGVKVLAIDQTSDERKDNPSVVRSVTFEVNTIEAQKLTLGATVGTLSLTLRPVASTDIENSERITINDLSDLDISDSLIEARLEEEGEDPALPDPSDERLENLEQLLKDLSTGMSEKLEGVEAKLQEQEEVKEVVVEMAPIVPQKSTIGVIRNGQRNEYKVDKKKEEDQVDVLEDENADEKLGVSSN